jgi:hypothetical protein
MITVLIFDILCMSKWCTPSAQDLLRYIRGGPRGVTPSRIGRESIITNYLVGEGGGSMCKAAGREEAD